jgi:hypothetical protein
MAKKTPAQSFRDIFNRFVAGSTADERKTGERMMNAWLKRHGKTSLVFSPFSRRPSVTMRQQRLRRRRPIRAMARRTRLKVRPSRRSI